MVIDDTSDVNVGFFGQTGTAGSHRHCRWFQERWGRIGRLASYQAALVAIAHEGPARARYRELHERLAPKAALMALACKLLRIA